MSKLVFPVAEEYKLQEERRVGGQDSSVPLSLSDKGPCALTPRGAETRVGDQRHIQLWDSDNRQDLGFVFKNEARPGVKYPEKP